MRFAGFIRSLNVGTHNRITMQALTGLLEDAGFGAVRTSLQSGNLLFDAKGTPEAVASRAEAALVKAKLKNAAVMVFTLDELRALKAPFKGAPTAAVRHAVTFLREARSSPLDTTRWGGVELVAATPRAVFTLVRIAAKVPNPNALIEKATGTEATTRWWNVVQDLCALDEAPVTPRRGR